MKIKKSLKALAVCTVLAGSIGVVAACSESGTTELGGLIIDQNNKVVTSDFVLPGRYVGVDISWTSSNENVIKLEKTTYKDKDGNDVPQWEAKVTRPDVTTDVKLTATSGEYNKEFNVTVSAIDADEIAGAFKFEYNNKNLGTGEYTLAPSTTYKGLVANISWSLVTESPVAEVNNNILKINANENATPINLRATFTYNGVTAIKTYRVTCQATLEYTDSDVVLNWYSGKYDKETIDISGYVVNKAEPKSGSKIIQMIDSTYTGGFYLYYPSVSDEVWNSLQVGTAINVSGISSQSYGGLVESDTGVGTVTLNNDLPAYDESKAVTAIDEALIANAKTNDISKNGYTDINILKAKQSTEVTLTGWKVSAVNTDFSSDTSKEKYADFVTLTKEVNGVKASITVQWSYYYTAAGSDALNAMMEKTKEFNVGDIVNVRAILGTNSGNYKLILTNADNLTKVEEESSIDGAKQIASVDVLNKIKFPSTITSTTELEEPAVELPEGATLSYKIFGFGTKYENGKFTIEAVSTKRDVTIRAYLTVNGYTFTKDYNIVSKESSLDDMIQEEFNKLKESLTTINSSGKISLAKTGNVFTSVKFAYSLADGAQGAVLDGYNLYTLATKEDSKFTLNVTVTIEDIVKNETIECTIKAYTLTDGAKVSSSKGNIYIEGTVGAITNAKYGKTTLKTTDNTEVIIYGMDDIAGNNFELMIGTKPVEGDKVVLYGYYSEQYKNFTAVVVSVNGTPATLPSFAGLPEGQEMAKFTGSTDVQTVDGEDYASTAELSDKFTLVFAKNESQKATSFWSK